MPKKTAPVEVPSGQKYCFKCESLHPLNVFYHRYTEIGTKTYCSQCKACQNVASRANYSKNREHYILQKREYHARKRLEKEHNDRIGAIRTF